MDILLLFFGMAFLALWAVLGAVGGYVLLNDIFRAKHFYFLGAVFLCGPIFWFVIILSMTTVFGRKE